MKILATGFGAFPGAPTNPTEWLVRDLASWAPPGAELVTRVLPVRYDVVETVLSPLLEELRPDAFVAFGLSAKAQGFALEHVGRNVLSVDRPDAAGALSPRSVIDPEGPATFESGLPMSSLEDALREARVPFEHSSDAGDYICNLTLYSLRAKPRTGFIHVNHLPEEQLRAGARAILGVLASDERAA